MWRNNNKIVPDEKKCYKCGSKTHSVFDCPKRSEIEKTFSLYDWIQYAKHGKADHGSIRESGWEPRDNKSIYGLRWLMTSDEHTRIRSLLRKRASKNVATVALYNSALKACNSSREQEVLLKRMKNSAVATPNTLSYNILMFQLRVEGEFEAVLEVIEDMESCGLQKNKETQWLLDERNETIFANKIRPAVMKDFVSRGEFVSASRLLQALRQNDLATVELCSLMMMCCTTSDEQFVWLKSMREIGSPSTSCFDAIISQLVFESGPNNDRIQRLLDDHVHPAGVELNQNSRMLMSRHMPQQVRLTNLRRLLERGHCDRAWLLFDRFKRSGFTDVAMCNDMLKHFCTNVQEQNQFVQDMLSPADGQSALVPDTDTLDTLLEALVVEGRMESAHQLAHDLAPREWGVQVSAEGRALLSEDDSQLQRRRLKKLAALAKSGFRDAAWQLLDHLQHEDLANIYMFNSMLQACDDSAHQLRLVERMASAECPPDTVTFNSVLRRIMLEGDQARAHRVLAEDMRTYGVEPNRRTSFVLDKDPSGIDMSRHEVLESLMQATRTAVVLPPGSPVVKQYQALSDQGEKNVQSAWTLFEAVLQNARGTLDLCLTMYKLQEQLLFDSHPECEWVRKRFAESMFILRNQILEMQSGSDLLE